MAILAASHTAVNHVDHTFKSQKALARAFPNVKRWKALPIEGTDSTTVWHAIYDNQVQAETVYVIRALIPNMFCRAYLYIPEHKKGVSRE